MGAKWKMEMYLERSRFFARLMALLVCAVLWLVE
jgi:hypothetical protein